MKTDIPKPKGKKVAPASSNFKLKHCIIVSVRVKAKN